jgi:hypothetical protein
VFCTIHAKFLFLSYNAKDLRIHLICPRNQDKFIKRFTRGPSRTSKSITGSIRSTSIQTKISKNPAMPEKADNCYAIFRAVAISSRKFARRSIIHPCTRDILVSLIDICPFGDTAVRCFSADSIRCSMHLSGPRQAWSNPRFQSAVTPLGYIHPSEPRVPTALAHSFLYLLT